MTSTIRVVVQELYIYPVKSCAPVRVDSLCFDEQGRLTGDREWAVVDESSSVVWQGSHPRLALIHPDFLGEEPSLRNNYGDCVQVGDSATHTPRDVHIWNDVAKRNEVFAATDTGNEVAAFLEGTVGARLRLVRLGIAGLRRENSSRVHVISRTSFDELAAGLPWAGAPHESIKRFRPNIVLIGRDEPLVPFLEEQFTALEWSDETAGALDVGERCIRCVVPNVDPATGNEDPRVLDIVARHSATRYPGAPICFGIYVKPRGASRLSRGAILDASLSL